MFRETINIDNANIIDYFKDKTIMVTGGAGSIGSEIVKQLTFLILKNSHFRSSGDAFEYYSNCNRQVATKL